MSPLRAGFAATLAGFSVMSLELAAVRLFAPHFGDSAYVWTNVIGVMLVALAAGAWLGGRLADPDRCTARLRGLLTVAGVLTAVVPLLSGALGGLLLPDDLPLDRATGALVRGSLVATLVAFAPPVLLAGTATPLLVTGLAHAGVRVGRASGLVATWGTLGSLAGTFATTHVLVPGLGSRATVWLCAALLVVAAVALASGGRRIAAALAVPLGLGLWPLGPLRPVDPPAELLAEVESRYQFLQVVRTPAVGERPATTELKINEGLDSFHSVRVEGTPWTGGRYYDWYAPLPRLAGDGGAVPDDLRVLSLGAAAGTFERIFAHVYPGCRIDSVEIDPAVTRLGRAYFDAFGGPGEVYAGVDARVFVEHATARWDVALVDAYERQVYVPAHVASVEFFAALGARLRPGGIVAVNAGGRNFDDPVVRVLGATMARVFGVAFAFRVPGSRNFVLAARRDAPFDPTVLADLTADDPHLAFLQAAMARAEAWQEFVDLPDAEVLRDDRPFLDQVQDEALAREIDRPTPVAIAGDRPLAGVETDAYERAQLGDWEQVVTLARTARQPSGYLRFLVGDARWHLHDLGGALAEYEAAADLGVDAALSRALEERLATARDERALAARARGIAARNGWLLLLGAVWAAAVAALAVRFAAR